MSAYAKLLLLGFQCMLTTIVCLTISLLVGIQVAFTVQTILDNATMYIATCESPCIVYLQDKFLAIMQLDQRVYVLKMLMDIAKLPSKKFAPKFTFSLVYKHAF